MTALGVMFANGSRAAEPEHARAVATLAEALGAESLWAVQHVVMPIRHESRYPYSDTGTIPGGAGVAIPDPMVWLAWVGAATTRIRLATGVLVLPQQHPLVIAKQVATLDRLTGGRCILGVGAGWLAEEFAALGSEFDGRGERLVEGIEVLRRAWRDSSVSFEGAHLAFEPVRVEPKPHAATVPIHIGGHSDVAAERAGRWADGFFPLGRQGGELRRLVGLARTAAASADRDPDALELTVEAPRSPEDADVQTELRVHRVLVNAPNTPTAELRDAFERRLIAVRQLVPGLTV